MAKLPWMPFYPADYLLDTQVLTPAARGIWMDLICHVWRAEPRGTLTHPLPTWALILRVSTEELDSLLQELSHHRICDISSDVTNSHTNVTVTCRRIQREENVRNSAKLRKRKQRVTQSCHTSVTPYNQSQSYSQSYSQKSELEEKKKPPLPPKGELVVVDDAFEQFWKAYPSSRRVGKKAALRAWQKAKDKPPLADILASIALQAKSEQWKKDGGQFIPHPATWLNQGRWADEVAVKPPSLMESFLARGKHDGHGSGAVLSRVVDAGVATLGKDLSGPRRTHNR